MVKRLNCAKAKLPPIPDAIPQAALPSQAGYDENVRDNSAVQKQAQLQFEDATLGEWFTSPPEFWEAWRNNRYSFKLAGFQTAQINGVWKVRLPDWVQRHINKARAQAKKLSGKSSRLAPSNRKRPF